MSRRAYCEAVYVGLLTGAPLPPEAQEAAVAMEAGVRPTLHDLDEMGDSQLVYWLDFFRVADTIRNGGTLSV